VDPIPGGGANLGERGLFWVLGAWKILEFGLFGCASSCVLREREGWVGIRARMRGGFNKKWGDATYTSGWLLFGEVEVYGGCFELFAVFIF